MVNAASHPLIQDAMRKEADTIMEANEKLGTAPIEFVLKLGRIMLLLFNFGEFTKMHHPLSPHLLRSFIEVFAALVNLIGFVILATVMIGIIFSIILKLILDLCLGIVSMVFNLKGFFVLRGVNLHFLGSLMLFVSMSVTRIAYAMNKDADEE